MLFIFGTFTSLIGSNALRTGFTGGVGIFGTGFAGGTYFSTGFTTTAGFAGSVLTGTAFFTGTAF